LNTRSGDPKAGGPAACSPRAAPLQCWGQRRRPQHVRSESAASRRSFLRRGLRRAGRTTWRRPSSLGQPCQTWPASHRRRCRPGRARAAGAPPGAGPAAERRIPAAAVRRLGARPRRRSAGPRRLGERAHEAPADLVVLPQVGRQALRRAHRLVQRPPARLPQPGRVARQRPAQRLHQRPAGAPGSVKNPCPARFTGCGASSRGLCQRPVAAPAAKLTGTRDRVG